MNKKILYVLIFIKEFNQTRLRLEPFSKQLVLHARAKHFSKNRSVALETFGRSN